MLASFKRSEIFGVPPPLPLPFRLRFRFCFSPPTSVPLRLQDREFEMSFIDLPEELLMSIIDYSIPENWKYYSEGPWVLNLRLVCSKLFIVCTLSPFHC
jgi:hypothetical protein